MAHQVKHQLLGNGGPLATETDDVTQATGGVQASSRKGLQIDVDEEIRGKHGLHASSALTLNEPGNFNHGVITLNTLIFKMLIGAILFARAAIG